MFTKIVTMKNKTPKDPFDTACWSKGCIMNPMKVFAEVFSYADIENLRREVRRIATHAAADKVYRRSAPCDVLLDMKVVRSALLAAHALRKRTGAAIDSPTMQLVTPFADYCCGVGKPNPWGDFPRSLSIKAYCHPYRVFAKLFRQQGLALWLADWEALVEAALSPDNAGLRLNAMSICTGLTRLLEAAHLVWVREGGGGIEGASAGLEVTALKAVEGKVLVVA